MIYLVILILIYANIAYVSYVTEKNKQDVVKIITTVNLQKKRQLANDVKRKSKNTLRQSLLWPIGLAKKVREKLAQKS